MIRAVIFDMYETLTTLRTGPQCYSGDMAALAGADTAAFRAAWRATEDERMLGRLTFEAAVRRSLEAAGAWSQAVQQVIEKRRAESRVICPERLHPGVLPMLDELKARGMRVGLITNCQSEEAAAIRQSVLFPYFDAPVMSWEAGVMKPDPAIFHLCMDALGVSAEECLYVGDGGSRELEAASALGMRAVRAAWYLPQTPGPEGFPQAAHPADVLECLG